VTRRRGELASPVVAVLAGGALTLLAAAFTSMSARDALELSAIAAGVTLMGLGVGAVLLHTLRTRPFGTQIAALVLTTIAALLAGAFVAARAMFISTHDLSVLTVILLAAGTVGVSGALLTGRRVGAASSSLVAVARRVGGDTEALAPVPDAPAPRELAQLAEELARMEERLNAARLRERTLEASRRELVAWVSHDLRTPLAGIRALVEALDDRIVEDPETVARYCHTMRDEVDRLAALVDDLFELSRTQAGVLQLQYERVSIGDLVSDAIAGSAPVAAAKGVKLEGRVMGPPAELMASAPEVLRVLRNLLENAIRHTPSDGSVVVVAGVDDHEPESVFVEVRDTGGGVPEADLPHVFDVAFRSDRARTPGGGAGLGLAIAKSFVEAHRGDLSVANADGGARFTVRLPREVR
jgi:signal transduction histidine kinase